MSLNVRLFLCAASLAGLGGCATIGESEFSCPGRPKGVSCLSATQVYTQTDTTDTVKSAAKSRGRAPAQNFIRTSLVLPAVDKPVPVRTPAQVMRAWTAPWEDTRGVLHAGGYHFVEVQSRRWNFGESALQAEAVRLFSIERSPVEKVSTPKTPEAKKQNVAKNTRPVQTSMNDRPKPSTVPSTQSGASK